MNNIIANGRKIGKKISLTHLYFNRFLAIRYSTAFFLFLTLYWAIFLLGSLSIAAILPLFLFTLGALTSLEQIKLYRNHCNKLPYAVFFHRAMMLTCLLLIFAIYSPLYYVFFPFIKSHQQALTVLPTFLIVSLFICFLMLKKLNKIKQNQDNHFKRIQAYEEIIN